MGQADQPRLFGEFVRSQRQRLQQLPNETVALRRRRTPGLRREELAAKAGISAVWCAWIEQGRSVGVSTAALARLARALELSGEDRITFWSLSGKQDPDFAHSAEFPEAPDSLVKMISTLSIPAYALNNFWDAVCWNSEANKLFPNWLAEDCDNNLLRYAFLNKDAKRSILNWNIWSANLVYRVRAQCDKTVVGDVLANEIHGLCRNSGAFRELWDSVEKPDEGRDNYSKVEIDGDLSQEFIESHLKFTDVADFSVVVLSPSAG